MRSHQEDTSAFNTHFQSGRFSHSRKTLTGDVVLTVGGALVNFFNGGVSDRNVFLPVLEEGRFYVVSNIGTTNTVVVRDHDGFLVTSCLPGDTTLAFASQNEWVALRGWAALGVFTNTVNGLVPAPHSITPGSLFLRDDGQWGQVQVVGIVDAFKFITDGTNTAIGSGPDTFRLRSSTGKIGITVTNNEAVFGDNANFTVLEGAVDHNALLNYVADQHVAHSGVILTAGNGLSGGGTIAASRTFDLDLNDLTTDTPVLGDTFAFFDVSGADTNKATLTTLNSILDHNALLNFVANKHIDHTGVSIVAGSGLSGGGDITTSRTLALDINGLTADTLATGDFFPFFDISGVDNNKVTLANLNASLDHNALLNYVANQHIDHTTVQIATTEGIQGGGTIAATRTLKLDINGLTQDSTPDNAADFVATYDVSAAGHKKVQIPDLLTLLSKQLVLNGIISPAQITVDTDNYNPANLHTTSVMRLNTDASHNLNGLNAGSNGEMKLLLNVGGFDIVIPDEAGTSTAANRFAVSASITVSGKQGCILWYDGTTARWRVIGSGGGGGGSTFDIHALTSLTAPDVADEIAVYDVSASAHRKVLVSDFYKTIDTLTAKTTLTIGDELAIYDTAASLAKKVTLTNLFKAIDLLTGKVTLAAGDELALYDLVGTTAKKVSFADFKTSLALAAIALSGSAADLTTGTVPTARLGTGTANSSSFLRGDQTWQYANQLVSMGAQNTTAGTAINFTGIPAGVKRLSVAFNGVSTSGADSKRIRLGTSGGVVSTGYLAASLNGTTATAVGQINNTDGFLMNSTAAGDLLHGIMTILNVSGNIWEASYVIRSATTFCTWGGGGVTLGAVLDRVQLTTAGGTDTFDAGSVNVYYE